MRTTTLSIVLSALCLWPVSTASAEVPPPREVRINTERLALLPIADQERVLAIKARLEEIMSTDRSTLEGPERAELRSEWKELKSEMKQYNRNGSVLYISTGALIIIILLLILIF